MRLEPRRIAYLILADRDRASTLIDVAGFEKRYPGLLEEIYETPKTDWDAIPKWVTRFVEQLSARGVSSYRWDAYDLLAIRGGCTAWGPDLKKTWFSVSSPQRFELGWTRWGRDVWERLPVDLADPATASEAAAEVAPLILRGAFTPL